MMSISKSQLNALPTTPGVYRFYDKTGKILYIGKAKNLRSRIRSYFLNDKEVKGRSSWIAEMIKEIADIKIYKTDSEIEAVLLESELINKIQPKYNTRQKDDKSYTVIEISKEEIPKVEIKRVRNVDLKNKNFYYFGPYTSGDILKRAMKILRKIFLYANCSKIKFFCQQKNNRPCLFGDIDLCLAPCVDKDKILETKKQINYLKDFLSGKKVKIISRFEREMKVLSRNKKYEEAAIVRDKIFSLEHLNRHSIGLKDSYQEILDNSQFSRIEAFDVSNISGNFAVGAMAVIILGKIDKSEYKKFKIKTVKGANDLAMMQEIICRRFQNSWQKADLIVVDGGAVHLRVVARILVNNNNQIPIIAIAKGADRKNDEFHYSDQKTAQYFQKNPELKNLAIMARNEAHRFAQNYYRKLHRKNLIF